MKTIIVGAGASGLLASILLSKKGEEITLLEKEKKVAKKLRATGNGRCNITNFNISVSNFHSNNLDLIKNFILPYDTIEKLFLEIGIPFKKKMMEEFFQLVKRQIVWQIFWSMKHKDWVLR